MYAGDTAILNNIFAHSNRSAKFMKFFLRNKPDIRYPVLKIFRTEDR